MEANEAGYASGDEKQEIKEPDGSKTILFEKEPWKSIDNYDGGEPYSGHTKVLLNGKTVFTMGYFGVVDQSVQDFGPVYRFLRKALLLMPADHPYRGPEELKEGDYEYKNKWEGEVGQFKGREEIYQNGALIYWANYFGGLVDVRK